MHKKNCKNKKKTNEKKIIETWNSICCRWIVKRIKFNFLTCFLNKVNIETLLIKPTLFKVETFYFSIICWDKSKLIDWRNLFLLIKNLLSYLVSRNVLCKHISYGQSSFKTHKLKLNSAVNVVQIYIRSWLFFANWYSTRLTLP